MAFRREAVIKSAEKYVARGKIEAAIREYRKVLADTPTDTSTLNRVGDLYARIERFDEAVRLFTQIAEHYTTDGFFVKAIAIYKKIIKLDPTALRVYEKLAALYAKQGLITEARTQYQVLADYYQKHDNVASAITIYQRMAELEPDNPSFRLKLADLYTSRSLTDKAMQELRSLAEIFVRSGSLDEATQVYVKALDTNPDDLDFIERAAVELQRRGSNEGAARVLSRALERNDKVAPIARRLGIAIPGVDPPASFDAPVAPQPTSASDDEVEIPDALQPLDEIALDEVALETSDGGSEAGDFELGMTDSSALDMGEMDAIEIDPDEPVFTRHSDVFHFDIDEDDAPSTLVQPPADMVSEPATRATEPADAEPEAPDQASEAFEFVIGDLDDDVDLAAPPEVQPAEPRADTDSAPAPTTSDETPLAALDDDASVEIEIDWEFDGLDGGDPELAIGGTQPASTAPLDAETEPPATEGSATEVPASETPAIDLEATHDLASDGAEAPASEDPGSSAFEMEVVPDVEPLDEGVLPSLSLDHEASEPAPAEPALPDVPPIDLEATIPTVPAPDEPPSMPVVEVPEPVVPGVEVPVTEVPVTEVSITEVPAADVPVAEVPPVVEPPRIERDLEATMPAASVAPPATPATPPPAVSALHRQEDLFAEAQVFAKYGLRQKAEERLSTLHAQDPEHLGGWLLATRMHLEAGEAADVVQHANRVAVLTHQLGDDAPWDTLRDELEYAGYRFDGDVVVGEPNAEENTRENRISQFLEMLDAPAKAKKAAKPARDAAPIVEAEPPVETEPIVEAEPPAEAEPPVEAEPVVEIESPVEADRVEADRVEADRVEADRVEADRVEADRVEADRVEVEPAVEIEPPSESVVDADDEDDVAFFGPDSDDEAAPEAEDVGRLDEGDDSDGDGDSDVDLAIAGLVETKPAAGRKVNLVEELGLDEGPASVPVTDADVFDESGMSWLDDSRVTQAEPETEEAIFDEEDDFFDLAAELERELSEEELGDGTTAVSQTEGQSLEEIVEGFKKGVAEHLSPEDYDTHFNLGIAYREMGLLDEAIGEFQLASKDARYLVESSSMLGMCFLDKGLPELAIKWYRKGLASPAIREDESLGLLYEMAGVYATVGDDDAARKTYVEIYGINSSFRDVANRLESLGG